MRRLLSAAERSLGLPDSLAGWTRTGWVKRRSGVRAITRLNCRQAQRVLFDLKPTPKRAVSELDAVRMKGMLARRADESRRVAGAVISGRAQACGSPSVSIRAALRAAARLTPVYPRPRSASAGANSRPLGRSDMRRLLSTAERSLGLPDSLAGWTRTGSVESGVRASECRCKRSACWSI
jgi:hypothetical protein